MEPALFRGALKVCIFLAVFILLSACSPTLNWRTVQSPEQGYNALFPGKPDKLERRIPYQEQEFLQTLEAVKVEDDIYSISAIQLTATQDVLAPKLISQLQSNLVDRAKASGGSVTIEDSFYQTADHHRLPSKDYFIAFKSNEKFQQVMRVRWITRSMGNGSLWIYQISVLHAGSNVDNAKVFLSQEAYANFFSEFYPE